MQEIYSTRFGDVHYSEQDRVVLLTWKQKCCFGDYRNTTLAALSAMEKYTDCNLVIDARNGFEDEKEDVEWGFSVLLPAMAKTTCRCVVFLMETVNDIEEEMDMWTIEFRKYFRVFRVETYEKALSALAETRDPV